MKENYVQEKRESQDSTLEYKQNNSWLQMYAFSI